jgi:hypothetical protein
MTGMETGVRVQIGERWTHKIPNLTRNFTALSTSSHFVEILSRLNLL